MQKSNQKDSILNGPHRINHNTIFIKFIKKNSLPTTAKTISKTKQNDFSPHLPIHLDNDETSPAFQLGFPPANITPTLKRQERIKEAETVRCDSQFARHPRDAQTHTYSETHAELEKMQSSQSPDEILAVAPRSTRVY